MNTSLFVGLCEDAGLDIESIGGVTRVTDEDGIPISEIYETVHGRYWIDTSVLPRDIIAGIAEAVTEYALTPIEERE